MTEIDQVYEPREDSFLIAKHIKEYSKKCDKCMDIGTGSGILANEANKNCKKVIAVDINKKAVEFCRKKYHKTGIKFIHSNLFSNVEGKFDLIICNPPFLPNHPEVKDMALDGGRHGYEFIDMFFSQANDFLGTNGKMLIIFSSLTNQNKVNQILIDHLFEYELIDELKLPFEKLFVYLVYKSKFLKKLDKKGITTIKRFTRGSRGLIYTGNVNLKSKNNPKMVNNILKNGNTINPKRSIKYKVTIKIQRLDKEAKNTVDNEIKKLLLLNRHQIGPKLLDYGKDFFVYEFIDGEFLLEFIKKTRNNKLILKLIKNIFNQMSILDNLSLNKEEMHHPYKHIIINKQNKPILVDFERCKKTKKPKNVTQFCQFLIASGLAEILRKKNIIISRKDIIKLAREYKKTMNKNSFKKILQKIK